MGLSPILAHTSAAARAWVGNPDALNEARSYQALIESCPLAALTQITVSPRPLRTASALMSKQAREIVAMLAGCAAARNKARIATSVSSRSASSLRRRSPSRLATPNDIDRAGVRRVTIVFADEILMSLRLRFTRANALVRCLALGGVPGDCQR